MLQMPRLHRHLLDLRAKRHENFRMVERNLIALNILKHGVEGYRG